jgi:hypothetical protein
MFKTMFEFISIFKRLKHIESMVWQLQVSRAATRTRIKELEQMIYDLYRPDDTDETDEPDETYESYTGDYADADKDR